MGNISTVPIAEIDPATAIDAGAARAADSSGMTKLPLTAPRCAVEKGAVAEPDLPVIALKTPTPVTETTTITKGAAGHVSETPQAVESVVSVITEVHNPKPFDARWFYEDDSASPPQPQSLPPRYGGGRFGGARYFEPPPVPAQVESALTDFTQAWRKYELLKEQFAVIKRDRNRAKRAVLKTILTLFNLEPGYIERIEEFCEVKQSRAYEIVSAAKFANEAGFLSRPDNLNDEDDWEASTMPDISPMAAAEHTSGAERTRLITLAQEGRLPSKSQIQKQRRGGGSIVIKLDIRGKHLEPDCDCKIVDRVLAKATFNALAALAKAGSERASQTLADLRERLRKGGGIAISISAQFQIVRPAKARRPLTPEEEKWRAEELADQQKEREKRAARKACNKRVIPKGWYRQKLLDDGAKWEDLPRLDGG